MVLRGNLAERGAIIKPSAATPKLMQHRGRAAIGAASTVLCTTAIGLGWGGESVVAVLMSCCLLSPAVYAISILWTEWAAERKRKRAVGEQSQIQNDGGGAAAPSHDDNARPAVDGTMEVESSVAADEALLSLLCLDGQHHIIERLRAGGHVGQLASVTELELEQAGLPLLQRRALMEALHEEGEPTTLNPLLAMARP